MVEEHDRVDREGKANNKINEPHKGGDFNKQNVANSRNTAENTEDHCEISLFRQECVHIADFIFHLHIVSADRGKACVAFNNRKENGEQRQDHQGKKNRVNTFDDLQRLKGLVRLHPNHGKTQGIITVKDCRKNIGGYGRDGINAAQPIGQRRNFNKFPKQKQGKYQNNRANKVWQDAVIVHIEINVEDQCDTQKGKG